MDDQQNEKFESRSSSGNLASQLPSTDFQPAQCKQNYKTQNLHDSPPLFLYFLFIPLLNRKSEKKKPKNSRSLICFYSVCARIRIAFIAIIFSRRSVHKQDTEQQFSGFYRAKFLYLCTHITQKFMARTEESKKLYGIVVSIPNRKNNNNLE